MAESGQQALYESRIRIYPRSVKGRFRNLKTGILFLAYGVYFLLAWLPWSRNIGPAQAVTFDIEGRRFYLFDLVVHAQDIFWLAGFLVIAAFLLFFVTGIAGRVFCGYFCFQTLWTDVFMFIERWVQGERPARMRLDKQPWSGEKLFKKGLTHFFWLLVAFWTGFTFTLYWGYAPQLFVEFFSGQAPFPAYATTLFLTATTYVMAGLAREQVCTYMCPYARFQSAMFDRDTLIVAYDEARGEGDSGRHKLGRGYKTQDERGEKGAGDCIDCGFCVQVCPTGIDIRNGMQYQCITCALCVDACDTIMDSMGWEPGLVKYTSENAQRGKKTRYFTPQNIGYGLTVLISAVLLVMSMANQAKMDMAVSHVRQPLFVLLSDGRIQNSYEVKINNKTDRAIKIDFTQTGLENAEVDLGGHLEQLALKPDQSLNLLVRIKMANPGNLDKLPFRFQALPYDDEVGRVETDTFFYFKKQ